jgi:4-amino-4-deoxy-L-arabinose transferase-like glycosyltransferase
MRRTPYAWVRTVLIWGLVCLGTVFLYLVFMVHNLDAITDIDALDYAQIARNLAQGKGFSTDFIKPLTLTRITTLDQHPDLIYPPLHTLVTSVFIRALGANKRAIALACGVPFLLTLLVTYLLGLRLFDKRVAVLGTALFGLYLGTLRYSISGLEVCLLGLWVTGLFLVLYLLAGEHKRVPWLAASSGALLGLIYLTKEIWMVLLVPALLYLFFTVERRQRWLALGLALGAFALVILPWCIRVAHLTGNPFFTWRWYETEMETMTNPGNTLYRSYRPDVQSPLTFMIYHPAEVYDKLHDGAMTLYGVLATLSGPFALGFFVVAILVPLGNAAFERLRYLLYAAYVLLFGALCWVMPSPRMMYPLGPIIGLIAAALFFRVLTPLSRRYAPQQQARALNWGLALFVLLQAMPLLGNLSQRSRPGAETSATRVEALCKQVADATGEGVIVADVPWYTAWYGQRTSIWLPRSWDDLERLQMDVGQIQYLLLTPTVANWESTERTGEWIKLWSAAQTGRPVGYRGFVIYRLLGDNWVLFRKAPALLSRPGEGAPGNAAG